MRMKSGTTERVYWNPDSETTVVADAIDGCRPRIHHRPRKPTSPIEMAMGTRTNEIRSIAARPTRASVIGRFLDDALAVVVLVRDEDQPEVDRRGDDDHRAHQVGDGGERQRQHAGRVAVLGDAQGALEQEPA